MWLFVSPTAPSFPSPRLQLHPLCSTPSPAPPTPPSPPQARSASPGHNNTSPAVAAAASFLRSRRAAAPAATRDLVTLKAHALRDLVDDLVHRVRTEVLHGALSAGAEQEPGEGEEEGQLEGELRALQGSAVELCWAGRVRDVARVKASMRATLWGVREKMEEYDPPGSIRELVEEVRAALLDTTGEKGEAGLDTIRQFVLEDGVLMLELRSLRLLQREVSRAVTSEYPEPASPLVDSALRRLDVAGAKLSLDEYRVRGKSRLLHAIDQLDRHVCAGAHICPLPVHHALQTLRSAIRDAIDSDHRERRPRGRSMLIRPRIQDIPNFDRVTETLLRGGQPSPRGVNWLIDYGCQSIVDLRGSDRGNQWIAHESWGPMRSFNIAIEDFEAPTLEQVETFVRIAGDPANQPLYVHCKAGIGRTGTLIALWRVVFQGMTVDEALNREQLYSADGGGLRQENFVRECAEMLIAPQLVRSNGAGGRILLDEDDDDYGNGLE